MPAEGAQYSADSIELSANLLGFLKRRLLRTLAGAHQIEYSLLGFSNPGHERTAVVIRSVYFLGNRQSAAIEGMGYDIVFIFAMPTGQRAQIVCDRAKLAETSGVDTIGAAH